jgi:rubrerythrin
MELGTFGAIIKYALDIETEVANFYETSSDIAKNAELESIFADLVVRGQKRKKTLERVRRENVTEMILEPIIGFDSDSYSIVTEISKSVNDDNLRTLAMNIETMLQKFYTTAAVKTDFLIEAAYAFELLAEKNEETIKLFST